MSKLKTQMYMYGQLQFSNLIPSGSVLQRLVIPDDGQYIADTLDCLENGCKEVNLQTEEQVEVLEERLKSWQV